MKQEEDWILSLPTKMKKLRLGTIKHRGAGARTLVLRTTNATHSQISAYRQKPLYPAKLMRI